MATFQVVSDNFDALSITEKVNIFKSTALQEPLITDLQTLGKFRVIIYRENS